MAMSELHPVGLEAKRLNTRQLICLLWADLNPDLIAVHKAPANDRSLLTMAKPAFGLAETTNYMALDDPLTSRGQMFLDVIAAQDLEFHKARMEINSVHRAVLVARGCRTTSNTTPCAI